MTSPLERSAPDGDEATRLGLRHLSRVAAVLAACAALAYVVPGLEDFRVWSPGEPPLFSGMFGTARHDVPAFAGAAAAPTSDEARRERLAEELGEAVAANLGSGDEPRLIDPTTNLTRVDPSEYEGITQRIEDPTGEGMRPFYEALLESP